MNDKLVQAQILCDKNLSSDEYFKKLLEELVKDNILTKKELESILF